MTQARNIGAKKRAASIRIRAELKGGQLNRERVKAQGAAEKHSRESKRGKVTRSRDTTALQPKTLQQLGISKTQSSIWQKLADKPEGPAEKYLRKTDEGGPRHGRRIAAATGE